MTPADSPLRRLLALLPPVLLATLWLRLWIEVPTLPERVPSHFGAAGRADAWMSPAGFAWFLALFALFLYVAIAGSGWLVGRLPARFVNLPHREHWLAPERLVETRGVIAAHLHVVAALGMVLFHAIAAISFGLARTGGDHLPPSFFWVFGLFLAGTLGTVASLLVRFGRRPS